MLDGVSWKDTWQPGTYYKVNDIVYTEVTYNLMYRLMMHKVTVFQRRPNLQCYNRI